MLRSNHSISRLFLVLCLQFGTMLNASAQTGLNPKDSTSILHLMEKAADWQLVHPFTERSKIDWHYGAFYAGLWALSQNSQQEQYMDNMLALGQKHRWK
ncbi:MAG: hypothetical protein AAF206_23930, partial [Bacteroidota bacterium]